MPNIRLKVNEKKIITHKSHYLGHKNDDKFIVDIPDGKKFVSVKISNVHGQYNEGTRVEDAPEPGETGSNKTFKVHSWFEAGGTNPFDTSDDPYITYTVKVVVADAPRRAILVACENTGYLQSLDDILPDNLKNVAKRIIDFTAEVFEEANAHAMFDEPYDKVVCLIDTECTKDNIKTKIVELGQSYTLDMAILGHGDVDSGNAYLTLHGGVNLKEEDVRNWAGTTEFHGLKLGLVYMTNCKASKFSDTWMQLGFKTSIGSKKNNYMPEPMFSIFWSEWTRGITARDAAKKSFLAAQTVWQIAYLPTVRLHRIKFPPFVSSTRTVNRKITDSNPVVTGNRQFRITSSV